MRHMEKDDASIVEALQAAGCDEALIGRFLQLKMEGKTDEGLRLLSKFRCELICRMHEAQKPVDILDYFIFQMKKACVSTKAEEKS